MRATSGQGSRAAGVMLLGLLAAGPAAAQAPSDSVRLRWTAPGDDGPIGTATAYSLRMSLGPITPANWDSVAELAGVPGPLPAGSRENFTVRGLTYGTIYYFAIRTVDDAGNWSGLSNVLRWDWVFDTAPPAAPTGLAGSLQPAGVRVSWSPNTEADLDGYSVYRSTSPGAGFTRVTSALTTATEFVDASVPGGVDRIYYQVTATDESGNESARSATLTVLLSSAAAWSLAAAYPNPSSGPFNFPVTVPASGAAGARLEVLDAGGRLVRSLDLSSLASGSQLVVWDGRNQAGQLTAPGVYRARLAAAGEERSVRVVRVP